MDKYTILKEAIYIHNPNIDSIIDRYAKNCKNPITTEGFLRLISKDSYNMRELGISTASVTRLLKDIFPVANKLDWKVLYFSFLDASANPREAFTSALVDFAINIETTRLDKFQKRIKKLSAKVVGFQAAIEFKDEKQVKLALKEVIVDLVNNHSKILFLLD